ncbi:DNA repair protein RecO [Desulfatibacillum aliphaticivorans]|uniref:DNA repair protein RecO n=1 Tax=Desulfatibacillum aliphaticivorans TaxID=218208 RepID=RECO_DESAL|nr:DNA repair protein RecO [Desulfatibacillum aliphaticivorans]B8FKE1.1 RecName: Full=DNA repair protein RecO; AltName: Full=Recombination protein O [Desulfatibacillum aliphaticivorans]ACL01756.1 DNA repair protein RecO [Desulfatibacillum aliphaticivorans]
MPPVTTSAVILRSIEYGDFDLIVTFFTQAQGKRAALAKNARKSFKRFGGALELFSKVSIVYAHGKKKGGLPLLSESNLEQHFSNIRMDIHKTALASLWAETIYSWAEEEHAQEEIFQLLIRSLENLDNEKVDRDKVNILFLLRFLALAGLSPSLDQCVLCCRSLEDWGQGGICFDHARGGIVCPKCGVCLAPGPVLSVGAVKQLLWLNKGDLAAAGRMKLSREAMDRGRDLLESFLAYHLGKEPKSLRFLKDLRRRHF